MPGFPDQPITHWKKEQKDKGGNPDDPGPIGEEEPQEKLQDDISQSETEDQCRENL